MKKNKLLAIIVGCTAGVCICLSSASCSALNEVISGTQSALGIGEERADISVTEGEKSGLVGTFTYNEAIGQKAWTLQLTHDTTKQDGDGVQYMYCSVYPQSSTDNPVCYTIDQRLKLSRDYTYRYQYSVVMSNPQDWGAQFARFVVDISGTFTYRVQDDGVYSVTLSNPMSGSETIYGSSISGIGVYNWSIHTAADYVLNVEEAIAANSAFVPDQYIAGRTVQVTKTDEEKVVTDDVFYRDLMEKIALYSQY